MVSTPPPGLVLPPAASDPPPVSPSGEPAPVPPEPGLEAPAASASGPSEPSDHSATTGETERETASEAKPARKEWRYRAPCTVCSHPAMVEIERRVRAGETAGQVSRRFGGKPSGEAIRRHMANHTGLRRPSGVKSPGDRLRDYEREFLKLREVARKSGHAKVAADCLREAANLATALAKMPDQGDRRGDTGAILRSEAWATIVSAVGSALDPYPEATEAVFGALRALLPADGEEAGQEAAGGQAAGARAADGLPPPPSPGVAVLAGEERGTPQGRSLALAPSQDTSSVSQEPLSPTPTQVGPPSWPSPESLPASDHESGSSSEPVPESPPAHELITPENTPLPPRILIEYEGEEDPPSPREALLKELAP